jgi:myo-inositol-1(or 4)-monophosphatase
MNTYLKTALSSAQVAGEILLDYFNKLHDSNNKSVNFRDIVTDVDLLSEREIIKNILKKHPNHSIVAEESGVKFKNEKYKWYIDPLDGTVNYASGLPLSVISIALTIDDVISVGVIFNPFTNEKYYAVKDKGAFMNGDKVHVSNAKDMSQSLIVAAFPNETNSLSTGYYEAFGRVNNATKGVLRLGSAALALAYLSSGAIDGFWGVNLKEWDYMAGILLVEEAGGTYSEYHDKNGQNGEIVVVSNPNIHSSLVDSVFYQS